MAPEATFERADLGMAWAVKDSFTGYIRAMHDGQILLGDGAAMTSTRQFYFPFLRQDQIDQSRLVLHFGGEVRFLAHHGFLSVSLRNPCLEVDADGAYLSIQRGNARLRLAELRLPEALREDDVTMWPDVEALLSGTGTPTFGDTYSAGEPLAPLTVRAPAATPTR